MLSRRIFCCGLENMTLRILDYDDVANDQRRVVYSQRSELMEAEEIGETILDMRHDVFHDVIDQFIPPGSIDEQWEVPALEKALEGEFGVQVPVSQWLSEDEQIHDEAGMAGAANPDLAPPQGHEPFIREGRKIGSNEACPCGSGRKYKHCHGKLT